MISWAYKPLQFFFITFLGTAIFGFLAAYFSYKKEGRQYVVLGFWGIVFMPFMAVLSMLYGSHSQELIKDFWRRVFLWNIHPSFIVVILFLMPLVLFVAIGISLLYGKSIKQYCLAEEFLVLKDRRIFSFVVPVIFAPLIEELGWRGYGVDSLRAHFNLFETSLLFGILWSLWHVPASFINGFYVHGLWKKNKLYVANFFISIVPLAFLMNWVYYVNDRGIAAMILFHAMTNASMILFKTEQCTKCIITVLLFVIAVLVVLFNGSLFFAV